MIFYNLNKSHLLTFIFILKKQRRNIIKKTPFTKQNKTKKTPLAV